jgi:hypothetical protein
VQLGLGRDLVAAGHFHDLQAARALVVRADGGEGGVDVFLGLASRSLYSVFA